MGSGVNDQRKKLHALSKARDYEILLVEHKDRLTRFGFVWFEAICPFRIEVVNRAESCTHDLMEDLVAMLTDFSALLYGQRRGRKKTAAAIKAFTEV
jgi:predicted site-specific integrase-resolvase